MMEDNDTVLERRSIILQEVWERRQQQIDQGQTLQNDITKGATQLVNELWTRLYESVRVHGFDRENLIENTALLVAAIEVIDTQS